MHQGTTNELTLAERIGSILVANGILKAIHAHPLTRNAYVPIYLWLLTESHFPYQPPVWPNEVLGLPSNQRRHVAHHLMHTMNYSPFFGIMDAIMGTTFEGGYEDEDSSGAPREGEAISATASLGHESSTLPAACSAKGSKGQGKGGEERVLPMVTASAHEGESKKDD